MFQFCFVLCVALLVASSHSVIHHLGTCRYSYELDPGIREEHNATVVYLLSLLPYPQPVGKGNGSFFQPAWDGGPGVLPAAELAVQHVNENPDILPGVTVKLINAESGCNETNRALASFIQHIYYRPWEPIAGVIGPACSESAIAISSIASRAGLPLPIVHIASSAELEDRDKYPLTFGVVGSSLQIVEALFSFIHHNKWTEVALLYDDSKAASLASRQVVDLFASKLAINDGFILFDSTIYDTFFPFDALQNSNAKIIAVTTDLDLAKKIMCIANDRGMIFPNYQWIIVGYNYNEFVTGTTIFLYNGKLYDCNWTDSRQAENALLDHLLFIHFRLQTRNRNSRLVSDKTYSEILTEYAEYLNDFNNKTVCPFPIVPNIWASTVYDAVWALLRALNSTTAASNVYFTNENLSDKLKENFQGDSFNGTSGLIQFDNETGFVKRFIDVDQINDGVTNLVGSIFDGNVTYSNITPLTLPQYIYETVNIYLAAVFVLIETILLIATVLVHILTLLNRKYPSVKASSPSLNQFFFFGCYTLCAVAIVYILVMKALALPNNVVSNGCHAFLVWLVPIAITSTFGILTAKTWRIYRIFIHFREPGPLISNKALIVIVLAQLSIDIAIGTAWSVVSPITLNILYDLSYMNENKDMIVPRQCIFTNAPYWLILLVLYKSLQILSLIVLCFMTRSVKNKRFSTISLSIASYLGLVFITILIPLYFLLWSTNAAIAADFIVLCLFFSGNGFIFLVFVLIPPLLPLLGQRYNFKFTLP